MILCVKHDMLDLLQKSRASPLRHRDTEKNKKKLRDLVPQWFKRFFIWSSCNLCDGLLNCPLNGIRRVFTRRSQKTNSEGGESLEE